jgi:hypothetical protein
MVKYKWLIFLVFIIVMAVVLLAFYKRQNNTLQKTTWFSSYLPTSTPSGLTLVRPWTLYDNGIGQIEYVVTGSPADYVNIVENKIRSADIKLLQTPDGVFDGFIYQTTTIGDIHGLFLTGNYDLQLAGGKTSSSPRSTTRLLFIKGQTMVVITSTNNIVFGKKDLLTLAQEIITVSH